MPFKTPETIAEKKLSYVKRCIQDTLSNSQFIMLIKNIFRGVNQFNIVPFLWKYQNKFRFVTENGSNDYCKDGLEFLKLKYGDCEDFTVFNASILKMFGIRSRIKITDTYGDGYFTHILVQYYDPIKMHWVSLDGTYRIKGLGGEPPHYRERFYYY